MKVILSRKGFDSSAGGYPSPILPDGTLLSLPIPSVVDGLTYANISAPGHGSYYEIMRQLKPWVRIGGNKRHVTENTTCHLDPDLVRKTYHRLRGWHPVFGQDGRSQAHLLRNDVKEGDLFLFFGLFRKAILTNGGWSFDKKAKEVHTIFGYMQIGRVRRVTTTTELPKWLEHHPHASDVRRRQSNNVIYEAAPCLSFDSKLPGAGVFKHSPGVELTLKHQDQHRVSRWCLPLCCRTVEITHHSGNKYGWKKDYFQSAFRGQEFVIKGNDQVLKWAKKLIKDHCMRQ